MIAHSGLRTGMAGGRGGMRSLLARVLVILVTLTAGGLPVQVAQADVPVAQATPSLVAAGASHTLMVTSGGSVYAAGSNGQGQLGNGSTTNSSSAVPVSGLTGPTTSVAAGFHHSLAVVNGNVFAWGRNDQGQLGNGSVTQSLTPVKVSALSNVKAVAAAFDHSLALRGDGTVWAWGYNGYGQLGNGSTTNSTSPVQVIGLTGVKAISAGLEFALALKADGTVWAWGRNMYNQLGDGTTTQRTTPVQVASLTGVQAVAAGGYFGLAVKSDGTVWSWGNNDQGQLGQGNVTQLSLPTQIAALSGVKAVAAGRDFAMALKPDGTVWAWGNNGSGRLGDGTTTQRNAPVQIPGLGNVVGLVGGGWEHSVAVRTDGTLLSWGNNTHGQLGLGDLLDRQAPALGLGTTPRVALASGGDFTMLVNSSGTFQVWGGNNSGQLGLGDIFSHPVPQTNATLGTVPAALFSGGKSPFSLVVMPDGTLRAAGSGLNAELGNGLWADSSTFVTVTGLSKVVAAAAGSYHGMALKTDGTVWAWGDNALGQLGDGTPNTRTTPVPVSGLTNVVAIAAGTYHSYALKSDGTVWAWGDNALGQLGDGTVTNRSTPGQVVGLSGVVAITAGQWQGFALKSDGTVWAWGDNASGELGDGTLIGRETPVQVLGLTNVTAVSSSGVQTLAISNGTVYGWGVNTYYQLGDGTTANRSTPAAITTLGGLGAVAVAAAGMYSTAVSATGAVWCWGTNCGSATSSQTTPVQLNMAVPPAPTWVSPTAGSVRVDTVSLSATDAPGANWNATFEVHGDSLYTSPLASIPGSAAFSGSPSTASWAVTLNRGTYYLRVKATAGVNDSPWTNLGPITVDRTPAAPALVSPAASVWVTTTTPTFSWSFSDPDTGDSQSAYQVLVKDSSGTQLYDSTKLTAAVNSAAMPPGILSASGSYKWTVRTWDQSAVPSPYAADASFSVDASPPAASVTNTLPASHNTGSVSIPWTGTDAGSGIASVQLYYATDGGTTWTVYGSPTAVSPINFLATADGSYAFYVRATDQAGNQQAAPSGAGSVQASTTVDRVPPTAFTPTLTPPAGQTAVKNGDTLTFGGTAGESGLSIASAKLVQYADAAGSTAIAGADIALTPGTNISITGTTVSGFKVVPGFHGTAQNVRLVLVVQDAAGNQTTVTSAALAVDNTVPANFTPTLTPAAGQTAVKNSDTVTFGGTASQSGLTIVSAKLVQYSDSAGSTAITGADQTLTPGTDIAITGTTISGSKAVPVFDATAQSARLVLVVQSAGGTQTTVTSAPLAVDNTAPASFTPTLSPPAGQTLVKNGDTLSFGGTAGESGLSFASARLVQYSDAAGTTAISGADIGLTPGTDVAFSGASLAGGKAVAYSPDARSVRLVLAVKDGAGLQTTVTSAALVVDTSGLNPFTPTLTPPAGQTAAKDGDTLQFGGAVSQSGVTVVNATVSQYSDAGGSTLIAGASIDVTAQVTLTGTSIGGSTVIAAYNPAGQSVVLTILIKDSAGNQRTVRSAPLAVILSIPADFTATLATSGTTPAHTFDTLTFGGTAGASGLQLISGKLVQYSDAAGTTPLSGADIPLSVGTAVSLSGSTLSGSMLLVGGVTGAQSIRLQVTLQDAAGHLAQGRSAVLLVIFSGPAIQSITVADASGATGVTFSADRPATITAQGSGTLNWTATVRDLYGTAVGSFTLNGASRFVWSWAPPDQYSPSGNYQVQLTATDAAAASVTGTAAISVYNFPFQSAALQILDTDFNPAATVVAGRDYIVSVAVENLQGLPLGATILGQVRSASGPVEHLTALTNTMGARQTATVSFLWTPTSGTKTITIFVWNRLSVTGREALSGSLNQTVTVP